MVFLMVHKQHLNKQRVYVIRVNVVCIVLCVLDPFLDYH